MINIFR